MRNEDTHNDKQLQRLFQSFEPVVPPGAWEGIAGALDRKRNRRIAMWWITAAAVFIGGMAALWLGLNDLKQTRKVDRQAEVAKATETGKGESNSIILGGNSSKSANNQNLVRVNSGGNAKIDIKPISSEKIFQENKEQNQIVPESSPEIAGNDRELVNPFGLRILPSKWPVADAITSVDVPKPKLYKAPVSKWTLAAGVLQMQTGNGHSVNPANSRYVHKNYLSHMKEGEQNMGGTGFSLQLGYQLNRKFTLTGGLQFRQLNTRQHFSFADEVPVTLVPGNTPDKFGNYPIIGYFGNTVSISYSGFQRNNMLEIPLGITADFAISSKWSVKPAITINTGFISDFSGFTLDYQQLQTISQQADWFRKVQISGSLSAGAYRKINRNLQWGVTLGAARMFTPTYVPDASVRPRNHAAGLGTQIIWRID